MKNLQHFELHGHTTFSPGDGYQLPDAHFRRLAELGKPGMAITDHGNISGHVKAEQAAKAHGLKAVFGCELYCETEDARGQLKHHLTALAATRAGYSNLLAVVTKSWDNFKYKPTTTGEMLAAHSDGLIVLSGCLGGRLATALLGGKGTPEKTVADLKAAERVAAAFREVFGDRYYLEVQGHPTLAKQVAMNEGLTRLSERMKIPLVVTGDTHYPLPTDQDMYPVLHAIDRGGRKHTVEAQAQSWEYDILLTHQTPRAIYDNLVAMGMKKTMAAGALATSLEVAERCDVTLPQLKELKFPGGLPSAELLWKWVKRGWVSRGFRALRGEERARYRRRVRYEMELMLSKGFADYFLVISDMTRWAKRQGIPVGPARGSAAASLVCYLLYITEVNPMLFPTLLFERFIDATRHDLPDVDLDFDDEQRWRVRDYLVRRWGADRVGNIGTFVMYKGKNSLDDIARVYRLPFGAVAEVKEMLIERASGDLRGNATIMDTMEMFPKVKGIFEKHKELYQAQRLEGNVKGFSVHAAGLVVSQEPLSRAVAVYTRTDSKTGDRAWALSIDKHDAEYLNALKIDVLGLTTMGAIRRCLEMIGMNLEELYRVPLDDEAVFEGFRRNEVVGVFQFDGRAMRSVNREVKPDNFMEICDINALARPGPLHSGAAAEYIMVKHGKKKADHFHPVVDRITQHTNFQIVYQEQILQTVRELGGFTWEEAALIRKLISKKQGEQAFNRMRDKFLAGCAEKGVGEAIASRVWKQLVTAGAYAFNAAHCVSYGMLAYWTMWLKQHHPLAFYCASLVKYDPKTKGFDLLKEATFKGVRILPPHPLLSQVTWTVEKDGLRAGFTQVPGIGEKMAAKMVEHRDDVMTDAATMGYEEPFDWDYYEAIKGFGEKATAKLRAFAESDDPFGIDTMRRTLRAARRWLWEQGAENGLPVPTSTSDDVPYENKRGEHIWVGYVRERNLKDIYELHRSRTGEELDPETVKEPEYVNYVVLTGEDETGPLVITVHRYGGLYERFKEEVWDLRPGLDLLLVRGYKRNEYRRAIYAQELWVLKTGNASV